VLAALEAVFATEVVVEPDHHLFIDCRILFLSVMAVRLEIKTPAAIIYLLSYVLIDQRSDSSTYFCRAFELDEDIFATTRLEKIHKYTSLDNVSSHVRFLVQQNSHVARLVFLYLGF